MGQPVDIEHITPEHIEALENANALLNDVQQSREERKQRLGIEGATAEIAETFQWLTFGVLRSFVFSRDGVRLPGMITVHVGDEQASFEQDWKRYSTSNATLVYSDEVDSKGNRLVERVEWGPFSDLGKDEAFRALMDAVK